MSNDSPVQPTCIQIPSHLQIGGLDKEPLLESLQAKGIQLNPLALSLFQHPGFVTQATSESLNITCVSASDLGFPDGTIYQDLVQAALQRQLVECPLELGPHLRLAFLDQPEGAIGFTSTPNQAPPGAITIASPPLDQNDTTPKGFYLRRINGSLWLRAYTSWPGHIWRAEDLFVFARQSLDT